VNANGPQAAIALAKRHWRSAAYGIVAAVAVSAAIAWWQLSTGVEVYTAARQDLVQSIVVTGQVTTPQRASIGAEVTARVESVLVEEGASVTRGQPLIQLDTADETAAVAHARAAVEQTEARVRLMATVTLPAARETVREKRANAVQARAVFDRTSDLVTRNFVSRAQLDDAQRNLDVAESQLRAAEVVVATMSPGGGDFVVAQAARAEARAALGVAEARLASTIIRAPADGILIARNVEPGDIAQAGKELMALAPGGRTQVVANIDERNLGMLAVGQRALVSADAYPERSFPAQVAYINPGVDPVRGTVEVKLLVADPPPYLVQDMTVSVDIEVGRRERVVVVPSNAVHDLASAHPWVLAVRDGRLVRVPVAVGMRGEAAVEITEGIQAGEALVPVTDVHVAAGQRVRARPIAKAS
jgi:HlyD family secretion protein